MKPLSEDLGAIFDGFFFHYLEMINDSHLPTPVKTFFDRIKWWQWVSSNFVGNPAAHVMFVKHFMVEHHGDEFWEPVVRNCHTLVAKCKETCALPAPAAQRSPPTPRGSRPSAPGGSGKGGKGGKRNSYSPAQLAKLATLRSRFPGSCLSRVINSTTVLAKTGGPVADSRTLVCGAPLHHAEQLAARLSLFDALGTPAPAHHLQRCLFSLTSTH